jgi:hypothetical protein
MQTCSSEAMPQYPYPTRCLRHVQDDRTDPGMLGGKGLELIRRTAGRKHHVQRLREADDGGPPDPFPTRW